MSFQVSQWPRPDDLARYHEQLGVPPEAIIRDIVRIVCVAQLVHDGVLDEDWVLSGGMGMRLRGSSRFTMSDTDTSRRGGAPDRDDSRRRSRLTRKSYSSRPSMPRSGSRARSS